MSILRQQHFYHQGLKNVNFPSWGARLGQNAMVEHKAFALIPCSSLSIQYVNQYSGDAKGNAKGKVC